MVGDSEAGESRAVRARDWYRASQVAVCDLVEPWAHGTVVRAARYPTYYNYNLVRVEDEPGLPASELAAFAEEALRGLAHRKLDFEQIEAAQARREDLCSMGWKATRLLWMHHGGAAESAPGVEVALVDYDTVYELRRAWHHDDFPEAEWDLYNLAAREVAMSRDVQVLAVLDAEHPIAFAQLEWIGDGAEISQVFVHRERRGRGLGTAITRAAILAADRARDLWIVADDEDRPKRLYERLGFAGVWTSMEYLLLI